MKANNPVSSIQKHTTKRVENSKRNIKALIKVKVKYMLYRVKVKDGGLNFNITEQLVINFYRQTLSHASVKHILKGEPEFNY